MFGVGPKAIASKSKRYYLRRRLLRRCGFHRRLYVCLSARYLKSNAARITKLDI